MCEGADSPGTSWLSRRGMWCHIGTWTDDVVFMFVMRKGKKLLVSLSYQNDAVLMYSSINPT